MADDVRIERVGPERPDLLELVGELFIEYQAWLGEAVCSARLAEEIASLPGPYAPPGGALLLALAGDVALGCVGVRPHHGAACEMKRLYVRPGGRRQGVASRLVAAALDAAREKGYEEVLLSTIPSMMAPAVRLYEALGFKETEPFKDHSAVADGAELLHLRLVLRAPRF